METKKIFIEKNSKKIILMIMVLILMIFTFAIGSQKYISSNAIKSSKELIPIKVKLSWLHTAEFSGLYMAKKLGYYEKEGLNVSFEAFDFNDTPIDYVLAGNAQIGLASSTEIIIARANDKKVKAFISLFQSSPDVFISLKKSGIITPEDLNGKIIGLSCNTNTEYQERAFLKTFNINFTETCSEYDIDQLLSENADVVAGFITNEPIFYREEGHEINTMLINDYGVDIYPNLMFSTEEYMKNNPENIEKFIIATKKGIEYSLQYPYESVEETLSYDPNLNKKQQLETIIIQAPLIYSGNFPIGWMEERMWKKSINILQEQEVINQTIGLQDIYDNSFIEKLYKNYEK
jgi:ABC-type nitrate/sulfonate/bicarbonate transport system substrate-binding protein